MKVTDTLQLALLGVVAWLVYTTLKKFSSGVDVVTEPLARAFVRLTSGPGVQVLGKVVLPNGQAVAINDIVSAGSTISGQGLFTWRGVQYQIAGRDAAGNYVTKRIIT